MIVVLKSTATEADIALIEAKIRVWGLTPSLSRGSERNVIGVLGDERDVPAAATLAALPAVESVLPILAPYKRVAREFQAHATTIPIRGLTFGGETIHVIAGPCSVETPAQMQASAEAAVAAGATLMRGGAFKPRTSPYAFQGLGELGLEYLMHAARAHALPVVTELMDARDVDLFLKHGVDVIQIGTRNMQNYRLLQEVGQLRVPVILKRGMAATVKEWLMAAEYIAAKGNTNIILAERGIRTFETAYRNVLDVSAIPFLKRETHLPVIVDPSHAGGAAWMVPALSRAAIAAGADGLLIECHPDPTQAWSDGEQALAPLALKNLMGELRPIAAAVGRTLGGAHVAGISQYPLYRAVTANQLFRRNRP